LEAVTVPRPIETLPAPVPGDPQVVGIALHVAEAVGIALHVAGATGAVLHVALVAEVTGVVEAVGVVLHVPEDDKTKTS
tara:strand:+ start:486 stop:722 length:237 start_codon:yes stop_codon:yes gene_type:complete